jgi:hypothetical protein
VAHNRGEGTSLFYTQENRVLKGELVSSS